ncbi:hypothetical protein TWF281_011871 [Arthrobotrys megalospora]
MDMLSNSSSVPAKTAILTPRSPVERPKPLNRKKKKYSLSSLQGQRFHPPGKSVLSDTSSRKRRSRSNLLTWQEFVMDSFGPTMSLASLVSWQDMLCYSPPPQGGDGPSTPPEIRDALVAKKKKNTRERLIKGIQSLALSKGKGSPGRQTESNPSERTSSPKNTGRLWVVSLGKASTFSAGRGSGPDRSPKRRFSVQSKALNGWASRAKKFLHLKKRSSKKGKSSMVSSTQDREYRSSSSGSNSPNPRRRLLARENAPTKITVRRPSHRAGPISSASSASASTVSVTKPVSGWTFLSPPGRPSSPGSSLPTPPASLQPPAQFILGGTVPQGPVPAMDPLLRHHSITANPSEGEDLMVTGNTLLEPRMSVADSTKSHETLWRRSVSSPSISSSYTSLSMPGGGSRHSSIWDHRSSIISIPRGSVVSIGDAKRTLRANLTGNLAHDSKAGHGREGTIRKRVSDTPTHTHVHSMFCSSGHLAPFHVEPATPDVPDLEQEPEPEQKPPPARRATTHERRPSIVKKDHMEIYSHPYFEVAPSERHRSLSSVTFGSRSGNMQRRSTMDSMGSFRTALDGTEDSTADVSFASF